MSSVVRGVACRCPGVEGVVEVLLLLSCDVLHEVVCGLVSDVRVFLGEQIILADGAFDLVCRVLWVFQAECCTVIGTWWCFCRVTVTVVGSVWGWVSMWWRWVSMWWWWAMVPVVGGRRGVVWVVSQNYHHTCCQHRLAREKWRTVSRVCTFAYSFKLSTNNLVCS